MKLFFAAFATCAFAIPAAQIAAQTAPHSAPPAQSSQPSQPMQKPPAAEAKKSAFAGYQAYTPKEPLTNWRETNDLMESLDGHAGHLRGGPKPKPPMAKPEMKK